MNKVISFIVIITIFTVYSCYKPSVPLCDWNDASLSGNTYKITKITILGIDSTTALQTADPCIKKPYTLKAGGIYTRPNLLGCAITDTIGIWKTYSNGGKNYIIVNIDTVLTNQFDCNSFTVESIKGLLPAIITWTKQ